uniref:LIM zinc-binding domain-containing protein n=1 Tax=Oryzias latipes TaxID=8090 RepID=A0A3P9JN26_ORYLA
MPKCPSCDKEVYFAERVSSLGKDWHRPCLKCEKCRKTLSAGSHAEHDGKPYCNNPCYSAMFGPKDGRGGGTLYLFYTLCICIMVFFPLVFKIGKCVCKLSLIWCDLI